MDQLKQHTPTEFNSFFDKLNHGWMLIGATDGTHDNIMTASWGGIGILWNKPVAFCFVRPQRYTYELAEGAERLSLSFLGEEYREALRLCGRESGRDMDKFKASGLTVAHTEDGVPYPTESREVLIGRRLYVGNLEKDGFLKSALLSNYPKDDFHRVYVLEIEDYLRRD